MTTTLNVPSLTPLAVRGFGSGDELAGAVLDLARDLLGLDTTLLVRIEGERWTAVQARGRRFGVRPGDVLPLGDTF